MLHSTATHAHLTLDTWHSHRHRRSLRPVTAQTVNECGSEGSRTPTVNLADFVVVLYATKNELSPSGLGPDMWEVQLIRLPGHETMARVAGRYTCV